MSGTETRRFGRIPEVIDRRRDDLVERIGAFIVAVDIHHRREVVAVYRVVNGVVRDV